MGASPYFYFVDYEPNIQSALDNLRDREFRAGRYNPVMPFPPFPIDASSPAPGAQHATIDQALTDSDADGTRSILDTWERSARRVLRNNSADFRTGNGGQLGRY